MKFSNKKTKTENINLEMEFLKIILKYRKNRKNKTSLLKIILRVSRNITY